MAKSGRSLPPKEGWWTAVLVLVVALLFGLVVLPSLDKKQGSKLLGEAAPDFALPVIYGGDAGDRVRLADLKGKAVVLDFWASWCGPCQAQAPIMDKVARAYEGKGVIVLGVNTSDESESALQFLRSRNIGYASVLDEANRTATEYGVRQLPTMVVIDRSGRVTAVRSRVVREQELTELIEEASSS
jgi:thiol-disulfide isomerase/thioredoxin